MERDREDVNGSIQSMGFINLILGAWLIISPWILSYTSGAKWNQLGFGIAVVVLSLIRMFAPSQQWASVVNGLIGLWLIIAPWIIGYSRSVAYWNEVIVGIVIAIVAFSNSGLRAGGHRHYHGTA